MNCESGNLDAGNQPCAATSPCSLGHLCYTGPAPLADVMFEQLEYLVDHASANCPPGCSECARLAQVEKWLLRPFGENVLPDAPVLSA